MVFSWEKFDSSFIKEVLLASDKANEYKGLIDAADDDIYILSGLMKGICEYPDRDFIRNYRSIIEQSLLKNYPDEVRKICKAANISGVNYNTKQSNMTKKPLSPTLIHAYITAILNISGKDIPLNEYSKFRYTVALNMSETRTEKVSLYDFQQEAVHELKKYFVDEDQKAGMLVMPTGSGKSRTATSFLIQEMISQGYQILWIAHRHMLIDQAADCFYRFAGLAKIHNPRIRNYRISCISGEHLSCSAVGDSEVIIASISSICRNKAHLKRMLGKKVMIVVDEAHHTYAPTYQDVIHFVQKCRSDCKLLGLTATPIRVNDNASKGLMKLYEDKVVYSVSMSDLIAQGILAAPQFTIIDTGENFEPEISEAEEKLIRRYKELPESLVSKIASSYVRNQVILKEYLENKNKYGKTLIFALNVTHCKFLCDEFRQAGVKCGLIYSGKDDNTEVINDFKDNKLEVLVNVNIMTEGTDVPDIETVFLTRPTQSEGLLMQMIGRGMRGPHADKGTEMVHIVDFHDKWETFNKWLNPAWMIGDYDSEPLAEEEPRKKEYEYYEWDLCQEVYNSCVYEAKKYGKTVSVPVAWYALFDEEGIEYRMLLFEDQMKGILAMMNDKESWKNNLAITPSMILKKYFSYFCYRPTERDIELLMLNVRENEIPPQHFAMENRKKVDPYYVYLDAEQNGENIFEYAVKIYHEYDMAQYLYGSEEDYVMAVCQAKVYQNKSHTIGLKVEELPYELIPFDRTPVYDIDELVQEVKEMMFGGQYEGISSIDWTDKPYKTYYGVFYYKDYSIRINQVLNSKDVPREVVKYVIYHEMLHRDIHKHGPLFRREEHKYPNYEKWDHFLDCNMGLFEINEW